MVRPSTIFKGRRRGCSVVIGAAITGLVNGGGKVLRKLLTDTLGAPSLTAVAGGGISERFEYNTLRRNSFVCAPVWRSLDGDWDDRIIW